MKCKDFSVGDDVIVYHTNGTSEYIREDKVVKVGRKYVTISSGYRFNEDSACEFSLVNKYEYGRLFLLFKDRESIGKHNNKRNALSKIRNMIGRYQLERYKKEHIDKILELLEEGAKCCQ